MAGHATFVAGLILQQAPGCLVRAHRVLSTDGEANSWQVARQIVRLAKSRPDVINLSLVCYTEDGEPPLALATAIDRVHPDTVVVAAAGNHGDVGRSSSRSRPGPRALREELAHPTGGDVDLDDEELKEILLEREREKPAWPAAIERVIAIGSGTRRRRAVELHPQEGRMDRRAGGRRVMAEHLPGGLLLRRQACRGQADKSPQEIVPFTSGFATGVARPSRRRKVSGRIAARTKPGTGLRRQVLVDSRPTGPGRPPVDDRMTTTTSLRSSVPDS